MSIQAEVFRGQHGSAFLQSRLASLSFVDSAAAAAFYALNPNNQSHTSADPTPVLIRCRLVINNPLTTDGADPFIEFQDLETKVGTEAAISLMLRHSEHVTGTSAWEDLFAERYPNLQALVNDDPSQLKELYLQMWPLLDHPDSVATLKKAGIDGAVYRGSGMSMNAVEYRAFDESQVLERAVFTNLPIALSFNDVLNGAALDWEHLVPLEAPPMRRVPRPC